MKKGDDTGSLFVAIIAVIAVIANVAVGFIFYRRGNDTRPAARDTVRTVYVDTVKIEKPVARDSVVVKYVKVRLPRAESGNDTLAHLINKANKNTDSAEVVIPITQKRYSDTTYTAWVSGFRPALDSIHVYPRREVVTVTNTVRGKHKRFGVGFHAGYGVTPHGLQPYIGVGVNYSILDF